MCQAGALLKGCLHGIFVFWLLKSSSRVQKTLYKSRIYVLENVYVMHVRRAKAGGEVVVRGVTVTPHPVLCISVSVALAQASPKCPCFPQWSSTCAREHLGWQRVRGAARGLVSEGMCSLCPRAVAPEKPGSAQCYWPVWVLREKLSTKLLMVFSKMFPVCVFINNLFLHTCNLQCDSDSFLSLIPKGITNTFFFNKTIIWKNKSLDRKVQWSFSNFCYFSFEILQMTASPAVSASCSEFTNSEQFTSQCSC